MRCMVPISRPSPWVGVSAPVFNRPSVALANGVLAVVSECASDQSLLTMHRLRVVVVVMLGRQNFILNVGATYATV